MTIGLINKTAKEISKVDIMSESAKHQKYVEQYIESTRTGIK